MMTSSTLTVADKFLANLMRSNAVAVVYLLSGVKLWGVVEAFDDDDLVLVRDDTRTIVARAAIATMQ